MMWFLFLILNKQKHVKIFFTGFSRYVSDCLLLLVVLTCLFVFCITFNNIILINWCVSWSKINIHIHTITLFINNNGRMTQMQVIIMYLFLISLHSSKLRENNFTVSLSVITVINKMMRCWSKLIYLPQILHRDPSCTMMHT